MGFTVGVVLVQLKVPSTKGNIPTEAIERTFESGFRGQCSKSAENEDN